MSLREHIENEIKNCSVWTDLEYVKSCDLDTPPENDLISEKLFNQASRFFSDLCLKTNVEYNFWVSGNNSLEIYNDNLLMEISEKTVGGILKNKTENKIKFVFETNNFENVVIDLVLVYLNFLNIDP